MNNNTLIIMSVLPIVLVFVFYLSWIKGLLILNTKKALVFVGKMHGKKHCHVEFLSCSGTVKKILRFQEDGKYAFVYEGETSEGSASFEIYLKNRKLLEINEINSVGELEIEAGERYVLCLRFHKADGKMDVRWERKET